MKKSLYIFKNGMLHRKDNTLCFETEEGTKKYIPIEDTNEIFAFGEVDVTKKLLEYLTEKEIILHFFNYYGYYVGTYYPREHLNSGYMILKQAENYIDPERRMKVARAIINGAIQNILQVLAYYKNRGKQVGETREKILTIADSIHLAINPFELMGYEGKIRTAYYEAFDEIIGDKHFLFENRTKRPPQNQLNALISFGNSLLYTIALSEIYKTHLDPRIGFLHETNFRRFSLNLDVAEVFKPILIDRIIFTLIGKKMITPKHFEKKMGGVNLNEEGKKIFLKELERKLVTTIQHRRLKRVVSYRRLIRLELYKLQKQFLGEEEYVPFVAS